LGIAESAYLASMPQAPTTYSPYGKNRKVLDARKNTVLRLMLNQGYISPEEYRQARDEEVEFVFKTKTSGLKAPHFVMYVISRLEEMYGKEALRTEGLKVITTLDYPLYEKMQEIVKEKALEAEEKYGAENAAAVAIEAKTGNIISMVGSRDYFDENIDGKVNIATAKRQPGSSFKPYVYLTALEMGYTPQTVL
jgi:membrane peptidoglycan carboxypeptidase